MDSTIGSPNGSARKRIRDGDSEGTSDADADADLRRAHLNHSVHLSQDAQMVPADGQDPSPPTVAAPGMALVRVPELLVDCLGVMLMRAFF